MSAALVWGFCQPDLHHQVIGQALQTLPDLRGAGGLRDNHADLGMEHAIAGVSGHGTIGGQFLDVDVLRGEQGRDLVDQTGAIDAN